MEQRDALSKYIEALKRCVLVIMSKLVLRLYTWGDYLQLMH
jgi:hypothetical protein